ncbi:tetratricopeptide repeat protein [uncultured Winogradskyella sp.]|uniref:tetratricopeptide repeat protein n=1 Tax=uncultured Winogradskyella sp. TaxID=395353 RepID=UPI0030D87B84|tara:strand:- start:128 stop:877 length:750 start_codon:yes stop_codon:yes gene_type:complete
MRVIIIVLIGCFSYLGFSQNNIYFDEANALYNDGKYAEAIDKYESILRSKEHSAELYFNLGNANYKLNNIAPSVYYYEKALQLSPNDKDILKNLSFAKNMTIDAIEKIPDVGFSKLVKRVVNKFKADTWSVIAVSSIILFALLFLTYHFSYSSSIKRVAFIVSVLSLFMGGFSVLMAFQKEKLDKKDKPAIVFAQETKVKTDPNKASEEVLRIHEGTKMQIIETYEDWSKIQLSDNSTGWIPSQDLKAL